MFAECSGKYSNQNLLILLNISRPIAQAVKLVIHSDAAAAAAAAALVGKLDSAIVKSSFSRMGWLEIGPFVPVLVKGAYMLTKIDWSMNSGRQRAGDS